MTDHDRGAYTPDTEEPLSFDARRPSERRPVPMTLIGSGIVLAALIGGVALVYRGGVRGAGEAPRPVGEPVMSVKTAAAPSPTDTGAQGAALDAQAQPKAPAIPSSITAAENETAESVGTTPPTASNTTAPSAQPTGPAPTFAAAPEQPAPRPAPHAKAAAAVAHPATPAVATAPAPVKVARAPKPAAAVVPPSPVTGAPDDSEVAAAGPSGAANKSARAAKAAKSAPMKLAQAEPASAARAQRETAEAASEDTASKPATVKSRATTNAATPGSAGVVVQIGAFSSSELADKGYADVAAGMAGRMSGKAKHVLPIEVGGKTLYRTWLSGFAGRADAVSFCEALKAKNKSCIVKG